MNKSINRRAMFAEIHQDTREGGRVHEFSLQYVRKDGTVGSKARCRKSTKRQSGASGYRGNVSLNHVLLIEDAQTGRMSNILIDLITHYNGMRVNHSY